MRFTITKIFGWIFGIGGIVAGLYLLTSKPVLSLYFFALAIFLLPPMNSLILKSKYAKYIKLVIGITFFISLFYLSFKPAPDPEGDEIKISNLSILHTISKEYCIKYNRCAESLSQLFEAGYTGPFNSFDSSDYFYRSIEDGKDCIISVKLSSGDQKSRLCIGDDLNYVKYLKNPELLEKSPITH